MTIEELVIAAVGGAWDNRQAPCTADQARDALRAHGVYVSGRPDKAQPQKWHSANEPATTVRAVCILLIVAGIVGLKLFSGAAA